jgi:hypothetical protein
LRLRQSQFVVGTSMANRQCAETESRIGFFVNPLALRTPVASAHTATHFDLSLSLSEKTT